MSPSPHARTEKYPVSETSFSVVNMNSGQWTKSKIPVTLRVTHRRQTPSDSIRNTDIAVTQANVFCCLIHNFFIPVGCHQVFLRNIPLETPCIKYAAGSEICRLGLNCHFNNRTLIVTTATSINGSDYKALKKMSYITPDISVNNRVLVSTKTTATIVIEDCFKR
jgi:hypothetical protein